VNAIDANGSIDAPINRRLRCSICGFSEVRTDEVIDRGVLFLAECPRCEHRWTSQVPIAADSAAAPSLALARFPRTSTPPAREVQTAA